MIKEFLIQNESERKKTSLKAEKKKFERAKIVLETNEKENKLWNRELTCCWLSFSAHTIFPHQGTQFIWVEWDSCERNMGVMLASVFLALSILESRHSAANSTAHDEIYSILVKWCREITAHPCWIQLHIPLAFASTVSRKHNALFTFHLLSQALWRGHVLKLNHWRAAMCETQTRHAWWSFKRRGAKFSPEELDSGERDGDCVAVSEKLMSCQRLSRVLKRKDLQQSEQ